MLIQIIAMLACIICSALFSASEMSLSSANRVRLENRAEDGSKSASRAVRIIDNFESSLSAILLGNNFVNIALSSLGAVFALTVFGEGYTWVATVIITIVVIICGETIPKIVAKKNANRYSEILALPVRFVYFVLWIPVKLVVLIVNLLTKGLPGEKSAETADDAVEELQSIIETAEDESILDEERSELVQAALDFDEISAFEVMTARVDMQALDISDSPEELSEQIRFSSFSRLPVYEDVVDNIIGVLIVNRYYREILNGKKPDLRTLLIPACRVYKTAKLPDVLEELRRTKQHLAIVTDEYGGTLGIVSMEDVLEQIVGEIWDEKDVIENEVEPLPNGGFELDGDLPISEFAEMLELQPEQLDTDSATVGGWTIEQFGSFPSEGRSFTFMNHTITVLRMDGVRVERLLLK